MTDPRSFGAWLRRERERRGITLRAIADRTKIGAGLLEALERGDVSRWPGGIYRRAFVRGYADVVGLDAELVVANFERVFPADPSAPAPAAPLLQSGGSQGDQNGMRLALVAPAISGPSPTALRTAGRDLACILVAALAGLAAGGWVGFWSAAAVTAIAFHLTRVLGLTARAFWRAAAERAVPPDAPRAEVVSFTDEQARSTTRRARARRLLSDLSAAAGAAGIPGRRRAARS